VTGTHDSSTLRGIEEELEVAEFLAKEPEIPETAKARLRQQAPAIRKRLIVAALRERKWKKLAHYARRNPGDLLGLPGSVLRYLQRRVQYSALGGSARIVL
jgi:4-alpha-glucanotransferase